MLAVIILFFSTLLQESSEDLGKYAVKKRRETVYSLAFLGVFWSLIFLVLAAILGAPVYVSVASAFTLGMRIFLEATLAFIGAVAITKADRSTIGFLRLLTIPLLLCVDIALGYHIGTLQFVGLILMFLGLVGAFYKSPASKRGAWLVVLGAIISVGTATLYKWNITHYNSVVGEQLIVFSFLLVFFYALSIRHGASPIKLLFRRNSGAQSFASGLSSAIESFAYGFAPASVVISLKRSFALMWSIVMGHKYFHEKALKRKIISGLVLALGLALLVAPYMI